MVTYFASSDLLPTLCVLTEKTALSTVPEGLGPVLG